MSRTQPKKPILNFDSVENLAASFDMKPPKSNTPNIIGNFILDKLLAINAVKESKNTDNTNNTNISQKSKKNQMVSQN